ncbi:MAG: type IV pilus secretin PilQ [Acidobacteriia bacterium]|nr:type IV pilus secretin PilQ [Terriglobia bacterium]
MKTTWPAIRCGCLLLASTALLTGSVAAQAQKAAGAAQGSAAAAVISSVAVTQTGERASVRVEGEGLREALATHMENPPRLVLDFSGTRLAVHHRTDVPGAPAPVRGVRLGQYKRDVARVVIDLSAETPYEITHEGTALVISFAGGSFAGDGPAAKEHAANLTTKAAPAEQPAVRRSSFRYAPAAPRAARPTAAKRKLTVSTPKFQLPRELTQPAQVLASWSGRPGMPARPAQESGAAVTATRYTGEPISVNLKDVDLRDFFRLIHEISGLNVILDPAVKGSLTIVLDEVPWDQALDLVLQNNSLDKQITGNVLRIATRDALKKEAEVSRDLQKAQQEAVDPVTVTRVLSYAKAEKLTGTLRKFLSSRGDILADDRSNQLIIRDIPSTIPVIDNLIRQLDRKSQQVEIEARVVSASRSFAQDIGVQLGFAGTTTSGRTLFAGNQNVGVSPITTSPIPPPLVSTGGGMPFNVNLGAVGPTSGMFFGHRSPNFAVDFFISAAEAKGVGKLLSKPKIITQNNEKAIIKQGTKIPIQTTVNNTISIQFIDAVLKLEVTPLVTAEGTVFMDVVVENTQIDAGIPRVQGTPALNTQSAETKVLVADGGTVVIGGIIITQQRTDVTQVPLVGSLPVIGHLFKRTNVVVQSQELLFFLTPRIIPG